MIADGLELVGREFRKQSRQWGFEHDLDHGSERLLNAAVVVLDGFDGSRDDCSVPWALDLFTKYRRDPTRRAMIAGALCASAINVAIFERGKAARS